MGTVDFETKEAKLRSRKSKVFLYTDEGRVKSQKDLAELLYRLFVKGEESFSVYSNGSKRMQCDRGRRRSVEDAFIIALSYFPEITYKQVDDAEQILVDKKLLIRNFCPTVHRQVHYASNLRLNEDKIRKELGKTNITF